MCVKFVSLVVLCCWLQFSFGGNIRSQDAEFIKNEKGDIVYPDNLKFKQNYMVHHHDPEFFHHHDHDPEFHHHHDHDPEFHHRHGYPMDEDEEDFDRQVWELDKPEQNASMQIPLEYLQSLNEYNVSDLLLNFVQGEPLAGVDVQNRFGDAGEERSAAIMPKEAACIPELKTVKIATTDDPSILFIPQCTRIERCGGCCKSELLSCQPLPSKKESVPFKVYKTQYTGEKKLKFLGTELAMVEKHNECKCLCRVKKEDCTKFQQYRESECRCACLNHDERKKCLKFNETKLWNPDLCVCQCRESIQCSTGSYFDQNDCKCLAPPKNRRRFASYERRSYRSEILPVVPLDEY